MIPIVCNTVEELALAAVDTWRAIADESITKSGRFAAALSGGTTPIRFYETLCRRADTLPWALTHIFFADERLVPDDLSDSNHGMIRRHLLDCVPIPSENVHTVATEIDPFDAARRYEDELRRVFGVAEPTLPAFDVIMLGIGRDGHVASLFPGSASLDEQTRLAVPVTAPVTPFQRVTLTFPVINHARHVIFLVSGSEKAVMIQQLLETQDERWPATRVKPASGQLFLLMDRAAGSLLRIQF